MKTSPLADTKPQPVFRELSVVPPDSVSLTSGYSRSGVPSNMFALPPEWRRTFSTLGFYGFLRYLENRDAHLSSCLRTRRAALAAAEMRVVDTGDSPLELQVGAFVRNVINDTPGLRAQINQLMDAFGKGWAILEVMWRRDPDGFVRIDDLRVRRQERFAFDTHGKLWMTDAIADREYPPTPQDYATAPKLVSYPNAPAPMIAPRPQLMPDRKFCTFIFEPSPINPYGNALSARTVMLCWYKAINLAVWSDHNERFGVPMPIIHFDPGTSQQEIAKLENVLEDLKRKGGLLLNDSVKYELSETKSTAGASNSYRELTDWCNDEISKTILGQTLTNSEGRRTGSKALGTIHERILNSYHAADAQALSDALTLQLSRWLTDFNFGTKVPCPRILLETHDPVKEVEELDIDEKLLKMGVPISVSWFYRKYHRPIPDTDEHALRYDDQNLFQYHLQYGVMTINEVRDRLGLQPVAWGEQRVMPVPGTTKSGYVGSVSREEMGISQEKRNEEGENKETDMNSEH